MSAEAQSTDIGQGASPQHEPVRQDIRKFDAVMLGMTLKDQLADQFLRINGLRGSVRIVFGADDEASAEPTRPSGGSSRKASRLKNSSAACGHSRSAGTPRRSPASSQIL